jgi:moderate conductance mechanosensitive channel
MRNGAARVLSLVANAVWLGVASAALAAPELSAAEPSPLSPPNGMFDALQRDMLMLQERLAEVLAAMPQLPEIGPFLLRRLTKQYPPDHIWILGLELAVIFAGAAGGEAIARRLFRPLHRFLPSLDVRTEFGQLGALVVNAVVRLFELMVFVLIAIALFFAIYDGHQAARYAFWCVFSIILLVRLIALGLRVLLAPSLPELRLPALDNKAARRLYWSLVSVVTLVVGAGLVATFLYDVGVPEQLHQAAGTLLLVIATGGIIAVIWSERRSITRLIGVYQGDVEERNDLGGLLAANWHVFATCIVLAIAVAAFFDRLLTGERQAAHIYQTLGILLGILLIDGLLRMVVRGYFGARTEADRSPEPGSPEDPADASGRSATSIPDSEEIAAAGYGAVIMRNSRIALAVVAVVLVARLWGFDAAEFGSTGLGARVTEAVFQIIITLLLASSAWSVVKIAINRHLPHEKRDALALVTDEGAGHGLSRIETLLPLVRMFLFVTIVAMTLMSVVSAMGVNIGPLLAGAGVVGIAVGFGAQTLVRDILSGIFFLFDDAFRIGEYIDIGEGKGTVERMSIRAVMLRHQAGYIYTVPFGAIRRVANYSRDWTIMKLEVRVPFSTDLERLRKVVKQVGTEMKADPEIGPMFLQPLKAQGVNRIDASAFVVRIKFMARPNGEAFVLRRHVFTRIQEAFQKNGIQFASPRVVVEGDDERAGGSADVALFPSADEPAQASGARGGAALAR